MQEPGHRIGGDVDAELVHQPGDLFWCLTRPPNASNRVTGGVVLQQDSDGVDYFGRFFSTRLRPPPAWRTRPNSAS